MTERLSTKSHWDLQTESVAVTTSKSKSPASVEATASPFMTAAEVAQMLRIRPRTLGDMVAAGVVPQPFKLTRKTVRWQRADIEAIGSAV